MRDGVQVGDPQGIGDQGPGTRAASGTHRDAVLLRPGDKVRHDQEVAGEAHLADDPELQVQAFGIGPQALLAVLRGAQQATLEATGQTPAGLGGEEVVDGHPRRHREVREEALSQGELQVAALGDLDRVFQRLRDVREEQGHLRRGAQVLLLAEPARPARVVQGAPLVDTDPHLMGLEVLPGQEAHVVGGHHGHTLGDGQVHGALHQLRLRLPAGADQLQVVAVPEDLEPTVQECLGPHPIARQQRLGHVAPGTPGERDQTLGRLCNPVLLHLWETQVLTLHIGPGDQPGQVAVAGPVLDQQHQPMGLAPVRRVTDPKIRPGDRLDPRPQGRLVEPHQGEQVALVRDRHRRHPPLAQGLHQGLDAHQSVDQGVLGVQVQMDEFGIHG